MGNVVSIADIFDKSKVVKIPSANGTVVEITYDPSSFTPVRLSRMKKKFEKVDKEDMDDEQALMQMGEMFCSLVKGWNLVGPLEDYDGNTIIEAGEPIPCEPVYVGYLPTPYTKGIIDLVVQDATPKDQT